MSWFMVPVIWIPVNGSALSTVCFAVFSPACPLCSTPCCVEDNNVVVFATVPVYGCHLNADVGLPRRA